MASKTQLRGHCPYCGNVQAVLKTGKMSKHGYTVEYGWFNGICPGQMYKPMELDREIADGVIEQVRKDVATLRQRETGLKNGTITPVECPKVLFMPQPEMIPFENASEYVQKEYVKQEIYKVQQRARVGEQFANYLENLLNIVHGQPLIEVEKNKKST